MRQFDYNFLIDGMPALIADSGILVTEKDVQSDDSGYDESLVYHRRLARTGVLSFSETFRFVTREEYQYMKSLLQGKDSFVLEFLDEDGQIRKIDAYCDKLTVSVFNVKTGLYKSMKFVITQN